LIRPDFFYIRPPVLFVPRDFEVGRNVRSEESTVSPVPG